MTTHEPVQAPALTTATTPAAGPGPAGPKRIRQVKGRMRMLKGDLTPKAINAFWEGVGPHGVMPKEHWLWRPAADMIRRKRKQDGSLYTISPTELRVYLGTTDRGYMPANRIGWFLEGWDATPDQLVVPTCGEWRCVRPAHQMLQTHAERRKVAQANGVATRKARMAEMPGLPYRARNRGSERGSAFDVFLQGQSPAEQRRTRSDLTTRAEALRGSARGVRTQQATTGQPITVSGHAERVTLALAQIEAAVAPVTLQDIRAYAHGAVPGVRRAALDAKRGADGFFTSISEWFERLGAPVAPLPPPRTLAPDPTQAPLPRRKQERVRQRVKRIYSNPLKTPEAPEAPDASVPPTESTRIPNA